MPSRKTHIQLYADECFPIPSVTYLKSQGYSIIHAYDLKMLQKSDPYHLRKSKQIGRILITVDRDFIYYDQANLKKHPGIIILSLSSTTPLRINKLCKKLFKNLSKDFVKESLIKATNEKVTKKKFGEIIYEKSL